MGRIGIEFISNGRLITTKEQVYKDIIVPIGFIFDGVTLKRPFTALFNVKDYNKAVVAACIHDYMCDNRKDYTLKQSTDILLELWGKSQKLSWFQKWAVRRAVKTYQRLKGGWKNVL